MPDTPTELTEGQDDSSQTSYATGSVTPASNKLILVIFTLSRGGGITVDSVTGNGITYDLVDSSAYDLAGNRGELFIYRGMAVSPTAGVITIDVGASTHAGCGWGVFEIGGVPTGNNGADAIQQSVNAEVGAGTSVSATLAAFQANSITVYGHGLNSAKAITADGSLVESFEQQLSTASETCTGGWFEGEDTSPSTSWTGNSDSGIIGVEVLDAGGGGAAVKTRNTIAIASVKTLDTIAIASVKSIDTISNV